MTFSIHVLISICLFVTISNFISVDGNESVTFETSETFLTTTPTSDIDVGTDNQQNYENQDNTEKPRTEQRSIDFHGSFDGPVANEDRHAAFRKRAKPLKKIFLGLYKNYKSTYLGNKTLSEYKKTIRKHKDEEDQQQRTDFEVEDSDVLVPSMETETELSVKIGQESETLRPIYVSEPDKTLNSENTHEKLRISKKKRKKQRLRKSNHRRTKHRNAANAKPNEKPKVENDKMSPYPVYRYEFGHGYNMSLDMSNDIVNLHLDGESLRDLMHGKLLKDGSEGRGKKYEMITRVLPLFIIPFLIQSAVVPFLVTKLKLLLIKSILVGKLAIFLLVISAIRNGNKGMQTYEVAPSYWAGEPSRRSELAAAASSAAYNGYRVEGKPTAWIN